MCFVFPEYALIFNTRLIIVLNFWEVFQHSPKTTGEKLKKIHSVDQPTVEPSEVVSKWSTYTQCKVIQWSTFAVE